MTQFAKQQNDPRHLGDGAYASHDGYHIWVSADHDLERDHGVEVNDLTADIQRWAEGVSA